MAGSQKTQRHFLKGKYKIKTNTTQDYKRDTKFTISKAQYDLTPKPYHPEIYKTEPPKRNQYNYKEERKYIAKKILSFFFFFVAECASKVNHRLYHPKINKESHNVMQKKHPTAKTNPKR